MSGVERLLEESGYSEKAIEYYLRKVNVGSIENPSVQEAYTGPCGDTLKVYLACMHVLKERSSCVRSKATLQTSFSTFCFVSLLLLFALLNILDIYITSLALPLGAQETNPLLNHLNEEGITHFDIVAKAGCTLLSCFSMLYSHKKALEIKSNFLKNTTWVLVIALCIFYLILVGKNFETYIIMLKGD